jgi:hypothetical protein
LDVGVSQRCDVPTSDLPRKRLTISPREFAEAVGKSVTYAYRQIWAGKLRVIADAGTMMIPWTEVERFLGTAREYTGDMTPKQEKASNA